MSDSETDIPEPDRTGDAPHPRHAVELFGHAEAEAAFLAAEASGRLHHAWLVTGPRGVGKATLAWRIARHLRAEKPADTGPGLFGDAPPSADMTLSPDHPVFRSVATLADPGVTVCRRGWDEKNKRLKTELTVDEVRRLKSFFTLSAADGGWRVGIVDAADEMNASAANALLKLLEEPPARTVLILVCHRPARLLPTIRSRCRVLRLRPLGAEDLGRALAQAGFPLDDLVLLHDLSGGSPGDAVGLIGNEGTALYPELVALIGRGPRIDRAGILSLAASAAGRDAADRYVLISDLVQRLLGRIALAGATGDRSVLSDDEAHAAARLAPDPIAARDWADLLPDLAARFDHARAVNLDPEHVILDMFLTIEKTASRIAAATA